MNRNVAQRRPRPLFRSRLRQQALFRRPAFERLEDRTMLDTGGLPAAIVVGRTLSTPSTAASSTPAPSYFVGEVQKNQVTITYTVYNEQADPETGVLLTTTLEPGVTLLSSSVTLDGTTTTQLPDQNGQNLAWSLRTISGYDRESVAATVNLPALGAGRTTPLAIDTGARAYATLDAGAVSASTPAATLQPGSVSDPSLLAATVDADTDDSYIQEEAAALDYNAQNIFDFIHTQIVYNSYLGSVRGARGTLWSLAGNALDTASLGVALMRASGIPAQYVSGTLSQSDAQELILSMFPAQYQTVGYIPAGTQVSDPANDPQLLSESESHYLFQFDTGSGMTDADPLMPGATIGQTFSTATATFTHVPQNLQATTEIQLVAEIENNAESLLGLPGLEDTTVLDHTFNDVELVGHPLTVGQFVTQTSVGFMFSAVTNTYSPYIAVGDDAYPSASEDQLVYGTDYQEILTNFPLGSEVLTGLFLNITTSQIEPGGAQQSQTVEKTIFDRIGFAARQAGRSVPINVAPGGAPALNDYDMTTLEVDTSAHAMVPVFAESAQSAADNSALTAALAKVPSASGPGDPAVEQLGRLVTIEQTAATAGTFALDSDGVSNRLQQVGRVAEYLDSPRLVAVSSDTELDPTTNTSTTSLDIDILDDKPRVVAAPGQTASVAPAIRQLQGIYDSIIESEILNPQQSSGVTFTNTSSIGLFQQALNQPGAFLVTISPQNLSALASLGLPAEAEARITASVTAGNTVALPSQPITVDGQQRIAWLEEDPARYTIAVSDNGEHDEYVGLVAAIRTWVSAQWSQLLLAVGVGARGAQAAASNPTLIKAESKAFVAGVQVLGELSTSNFMTGGTSTNGNWTGASDPSAADQLFGTYKTEFSATNEASAVDTVTPKGTGGVLSGTTTTGAVSISGGLAASWASAAINAFASATLSSSNATVKAQGGQAVGSGTIALLSSSAVPLSITGKNGYQVDGTGNLSFYGPAESSLGGSANWDSYSATVSGNVSMTLTTDGLTLNGQTLPAGTYTITTSSATLSGSGTTSSPNFAGSASITATNGTINFGPGRGDLSVGGKPLDSGDETTLDGYDGTISVSVSGNGTDSVSLSGSASNVLQAAVSPPPQPSPTSGGGRYVTDQNTPITFASNIETSLADTYNLTANAPTGWTVSIDSNGNVTATPAPGLQSGTYPIQIIAQSQTDPSLVAQTTVDVTIKPTQPGINLTVASDPQFTVPYNGAQLPTAFRASIQNLGPAADTYNLTLSNVPTGFTLLDSGTSVTVPAGQTAVLGIYLQPNAGQPIPPPGTQLSFTVTATSTTDSSITQTQTETFSVSAIDAVTITASPSAVSTTPGVAATDTLTLTNAGNVPENLVPATPTAATTMGLSVSGLAPVSLAVGQSTTETVTLTPGASTPLNSTLEATITVTFGPAGSPVTQTLVIPVQVEVPGATAVANASVAAGQLGSTNLADRLNDLSTALTNLVENPTSQVYMSQSSASLSAVVSLLSTDPYLGSFAPTLTADGAALAQATTPSAIQAALARLGTDLGTVGTTLTDEAAHEFTLSLLTNSQVAQPQVPATFPLVLQNTGSQTTTYDLGISGLPSGVTAAFSQPSITLGPGEVTPGSTGVPAVTVTLTPTSTTELAAFSFTVTATGLGASEITRSTTGSLTARSQLVQVVSVTPSPTFTNPGGQVEVSARILNAVNEQQQAEVSYSVTDANNNVIFTSQPVLTTLDVLTTLSTVDLGNLDTTGFALGQDTINVTVDDSSGNPFPGATGTGSLLIGTPVTATLATTPGTLPAGNGTVTATLQVGLNPADVTTSGLVGQVATSAGDWSVALLGNYAYVGGVGAITIVDVSNPASPTIVKTFGSGDFPANDETFVQISGSELIVNASPPGTTPESLLIYSVADPLNPVLLGQTPVSPGSGFTLFPPLVVNNHVYLHSAFFRYDEIGYQIEQQHGELISIDISNPAAPVVDGVVYNLPPDPTSGYPDGDSFVYQVAAVNNQTLLAGSTTSTGTTLPGTGVVMVVDTKNASSPSLVRTVPIPGTAVILGIAMESANRALVVGSTGNLDSDSPGPYPLFSGNLVLATLDLTDPQNPTVIATQTLSQSSQLLIPGDLVPLGNDMFALGNGQLRVDNNPELLLIDASQPGNAVVTTLSVPTSLTDYAKSGNLLYTVSTSGLLIYNLATSSSNIPVTAIVTAPANDGVSIVPNSFNVTPTSITTNPDGSETLEWDLGLSSSASSQTFTWQENVTGVQAGESLLVARNASVEFANQGTTSTLTLPDQFVAGEQIIGLSPPTQTVAPGASASYDVTLLNPTSSPVTYDLTVQGVAAGWVNLESSVTVAGNGSVDVPLVLISDSFSALSDYGFSVSVSGTNGATASVQGDLVLQGQPVTPDPNSHGIVATFTPALAAAGRGTSARFVVQLANTGSADDTFMLTAAGLPPGVAASFGQTSIEVPPGVSNFRDVTLTLTPAAGTSPGSIPFQVIATSATKSSVSNAASGTLKVLAGGVSVSLNPPSGAPGSSFKATVTNTGTVADTFELALGGPAALVASLATKQVTLSPGGSQVIPISTGAVNFALQGGLNLTTSATSTTNPAIQGAAAASLTISPSQSMTAAFNPALHTLAKPGTASFLLMVHNTGNSQDSYSATIVGTSGPVAATLVGLDGSPTQSIPVFILPGLSTGAILVQADLGSLGTGTVTVEVKSLTDGAITASPTATVGAVSANGPAVTDVQRFGYHMMPTTVLLTFDEALDATTADDLKNYQIIGPGGRAIRVRSAVYDQTSQTVTLRPSHRINIHDKYTLVVDGKSKGAISSTQGQLLDSKAGGPGSDFKTSLTWRNLVLDPPLPKGSLRARTAASAKKSI